VPVKIYVKQSSQKSLVVLGKIQQAVDAYGRGLVAERLRAAGLPERTLTPVVPTPVNADTEAERASGVLAFIIPLFILQWIVVGGQATAIDATAGEKERGTLEALLVTPVSRLEVVTGKLLAVVTFSVTATVFSMLGLALTGLAARTLLPSALANVRGSGTGSGSSVAQVFGGNLSIGLDGFLMLLAVGLTVAAFIAAVLLAVCIFARSFKEAQTYIAPIALVITLPAIALQFADFITRSASLYATPVVGSMLVILDVVKGVVNWQNALVAVGVNLVCAAVALTLALRSFRREQVLFRN
jgi:sodium transport system permease protein